MSCGRSGLLELRGNVESSPRGLATLALLKARFDEGRDHLELLEPFVADAALACPDDSFLPAQIATLVQQRTGIRIPSDAAKTVLGRFAGRKQLRRDGGRFLDPKMPDPDLEGAREAESARVTALGEALTDYLTEWDVVLEHEEALASLARFITDNKVPLVLEEDLPDSPLDRSGLGRKLTRLIARFVTDVCLEDADLREALTALTEGVVLEDMLLLRDISSHPERFRDLTIILDTGILLAALDLHGVANGQATREFLTIVREAGATTIAFDRTLNEIRRILAVYEDHLATPGGRLTLYPTELTHHVLTSQWGPSDIRTISATLEKRLSAIAIPVWELPDRDRRFTLDEPALAEALKDDHGKNDTPRIRHDVNVVASTLTLRRGQTATSMERSKAVFCTTSGRVIRNTQQWYREQGEHGVPPIVHQYALSSIAWFKKPAAGFGVKLHELAAICAAALRPARSTWDRFVRNLEELRQDGVITDDEAVAIVASELTEPLLARVDDSGEPDSDTIRDVIDRVRMSYRTEIEAAAKTEVASAQRETELARQEAERSGQLLASVEETATRRGKRIGETISVVVFWLGLLVLIPAAVFSLFPVEDGANERLQLFARVVTVVAIVLGLYTQVRGPSLLQIRQRLSEAIAKGVRGFLLGKSTQELQPTSQSRQRSDGSTESDETAPNNR